jgi:hypothetical protein
MTRGRDSNNLRSLASLRGIAALDVARDAPRTYPWLP